jgi:hypothetical protein
MVVPGKEGIVFRVILLLLALGLASYFCGYYSPVWLVAIFSLLGIIGSVSLARRAEDRQATWFLVFSTVVCFLLPLWIGWIMGDLNYDAWSVKIIEWLNSFASY